MLLVDVFCVIGGVLNNSLRPTLHVVLTMASAAYVVI